MRIWMRSFALRNARREKTSSGVRGEGLGVAVGRLGAPVPTFADAVASKAAAKMKSLSISNLHA